MLPSKEQDQTAGGEHISHVCMRPGVYRGVSPHQSTGTFVKVQGQMAVY